MEGKETTAHSENTQNINVHSEVLTFWNQPDLYAQCLCQISIWQKTLT